MFFFLGAFECLFCKKKQTKTIITSDMILLLLLVLHFFALSLKAYIIL